MFDFVKDLQFRLWLGRDHPVDEIDMAALPQEYQHEPAGGLYAGATGLDVINPILEGAANHLTENGIMIVETGNSREALVRQYPDVPFLWLEFEHGGEGVFLLGRDELIKWFAGTV